jgi:hypothetical protein
VTLHFHGTPITPASALSELAGCCFCVSYARPEQVERCHEIGQAVMIDNGAFSIWQKVRQGKPIPERLSLAALGDWSGYYAWAERWLRYPTTWAVIPDVIEGDEAENDAVLAEWPFGDRGAPVWHMYESLDRLCRLDADWPKVCIGSSGEFATLGTPRWHRRMEEAFNAVWLGGTAPNDLHLLRGLHEGRIGPYPFASLDSSDVAQNHWRRRDPGEKARRWDSVQCPVSWEPREHLELVASIPSKGLGVG